MIVNTDCEVTAAEFMRKKPFVRRGPRRFELKICELRERTLRFVARLSESAFSLI
jgi:hypothetical protein